MRKNEKRKTQSGITFIEILFVIIIIGILVGTVRPQFRKTFNSLQLNGFSRELQTFMNYLHQRSIVEGRVIYLNIDDENKECWAKIKEDVKRLRTYQIPNEIKIETEQKEVIFYPDGNIDKVTIKLANLNNESVILTTKGVFGGVKLQAEK